MKTVLLFVVVALLFLTAYSYGSDLLVSPEEAKKKKYDVYLDVRTSAERQALGSYPGSIHIPAGDLEQEAPKQLTNKSASILVYCNTGQRSRKAAETLRSMGYTNVRYIATSYKNLL
jgi:phage shock protein E